jgi:hypothetical protein
LKISVGRFFGRPGCTAQAADMFEAVYSDQSPDSAALYTPEWPGYIEN